MENNIEGMRAQEAKIREQMKFDKAVMGELVSFDRFFARFLGYGSFIYG